MPEQEKMENLEKKHISVLLNELVDSIDINKNKVNIVVDCTLGM
jgi:16S rRNA C1402 N4-methylase RsmH